MRLPSSYRTWILLLCCLLACSALGTLAKEKENHAARKAKLQKILSLIETPSVDEVENMKSGEKHGHITEEWSSFAQDVQDYHASLMEIMREMGREVRSELLRELKTEGPDFRSRWQQAYAKVKESIGAIKSGDIKDTLKHRVATLEEKFKGDKTFKGMWKKVKDKLMDEFESVEDLLKDELRVLRNKIDKIFHRVEHHVMHKEHHPVLKCGSCGKQLTLGEFLEHYPDLVIEDEDWWSDIDVENFYLGWPEWANRYAVKCPACGAANWVGVDFVSAQEEQKLEREAHATATAEEIIA